MGDKISFVELESVNQGSRLRLEKSYAASFTSGGFGCGTGIGDPSATNVLDGSGSGIPSATRVSGGFGCGTGMGEPSATSASGGLGCGTGIGEPSAHWVLPLVVWFVLTEPLLITTMNPARRKNATTALLRSIDDTSWRHRLALRYNANF
jgi:hypothetical protein